MGTLMLIPAAVITGAQFSRSSELSTVPLPQQNRAEYIMLRDTEVPCALCVHPLCLPRIGRSCHPYSGGAGLPTLKQGGTSAPCRISRLR